MTIDFIPSRAALIERGLQPFIADGRDVFSVRDVVRFLRKLKAAESVEPSAESVRKHILHFIRNRPGAVRAKEVSDAVPAQIYRGEVKRALSGLLDSGEIALVQQAPSGGRPRIFYRATDRSDAKAAPSQYIRTVPRASKIPADVIGMNAFTLAMRVAMRLQDRAPYVTNTTVTNAIAGVLATSFTRRLRTYMIERGFLKPGFENNRTVYQIGFPYGTGE